MNGEIYLPIFNRDKTIFKAQQKKKKRKETDLPRCHRGISTLYFLIVDLSKLLLVAKVTRLPLDCIASLSHNGHGHRRHGNKSIKDYARK